MFFNDVLEVKLFHQNDDSVIFNKAKENDFVINLVLENKLLSIYISYIAKYFKIL